MRLVATGLSLITSIIYFIIAFGLVPAGFESPPAQVMFVAGLAYLIGGALITRASERLLLVGAVLNLLVLTIFVISAISGKSTMDAISLTGKTAQVGLELVLLGLIMNGRDDR
jgi:hypothetical protein